MRWKPYPSYSDTGDELLGSIPSHWKAQRLKYLADVRLSNVDKLSVEDQATVRLANYVDVYKNERITADMDLMVATASDDQIERLALAAQDVLITKDSESPDDIAVPAYVPEPMEGVVCGYHLALLRPDADRLHGGFLHRWLQGKASQAYFSSHANGMTRYGIGRGDIGDAPLPWAPLEEQRAIAAFLDRETAKIDALIAEQRILVERLREKRQATMSGAVSKGISPGASPKDSGVQWLETIPDHWEIRKISSLTSKITNGYVGPTRDILLDEGVRYLQSLHIKQNQIIFDPPYFVSEMWSDDHARSILKQGDVLVVQTGDIGQCAVVPKEFEGCNCHALIVLEPLSGIILGEFLSWVLNSDYGNACLSSIQTGALHPHLNCGAVKDVFVPVPPVREQEAIIELIKDRLGQFDLLIAETETSIALLQEHRSALITAVVTGKVDVRGLAEGASV